MLGIIEALNCMIHFFRYEFSNFHLILKHMMVFLFFLKNQFSLHNTYCIILYIVMVIKGNKLVDN